MNKDEKNELELHNKKIKIKLIVYMCFLGFVILLVLITGSYKQDKKRNINNDTPNTIKETTYYDMQKELYEGTYNYEFKVGNDITYTGISKETTRTGFKESNGTIIKYEETNDKVYKIDGTDKEEYEELYKDINKDLFDFKKLFDKINSSSTIKAKEGDINTYNYDNVDNYKIVVNCDSKHIISINISTDVNYTFTFTF